MIVCRWKVLLCGASFHLNENYNLADFFYKQASTAAELEYGEESAASGVVLQQYAAFLEAHGRVSEALQCQMRVRKIMQEYAESEKFPL